MLDFQQFCEGAFVKEDGVGGVMGNTLPVYGDKKVCYAEKLAEMYCSKCSL